MHHSEFSSGPISLFGCIAQEVPEFLSQIELDLMYRPVYFVTYPGQKVNHPCTLSERLMQLGPLRARNSRQKLRDDK